MSLTDRCSAIRLILSDVDGVLTDGRLVYDNAGMESKAFHIRDGQGIRLWQQAGLHFGIITARTSEVVKMRAEELGIAIVRQGALDKLAAVREIATEHGLSLSAVCYMGDDLPDLAPLQSVGLGVAVADAAEEVRHASAYVTNQPGGQGAVRELIELILKNTGRWETTIRKYSI